MGSFHPNFFRPRRCAPLARRAGGIAVGCPGAMLGAAVPNMAPLSSGWQTHEPIFKTGCQNLKKKKVYRELKKTSTISPNISLIMKKRISPQLSFPTFWSGASLCWKEISEPDSIPTNIPDVFPPEFYCFEAWGRWGEVRRNFFPQM